MKVSGQLKAIHPEMTELIDFAVDKYGEPDDALASAAGGYHNLPDIHTDPSMKNLVKNVRAEISSINS